MSARLSIFTFSSSILITCRSDDGSNSEGDNNSDDIPGPSNTGYAGTLRPYTGPTTITDAGTKIEDFSSAGSLTIDADNGVLSNFSIDATNQFYSIKIESGHTGIVIEYGEIYNMMSAAMLGVGFTASHLNIHELSPLPDYQVSTFGSIIEHNV